MSANFHTGDEVVNYPWDTWAKLHADDSWFQFVSHEFADTVHLHSYSGYMNECNDGITDGYAWYQVQGGRQDYTTYFHHGREVTIELSYIKIQYTDSLLSYWNFNKRSFLNYIEEASYGINGQVTDSITDAPLNAMIMISGHDTDNSWEYSNASTGWYYRPIAQGNWALTFTCNGYRPKTIEGVNVMNRETTRLNVKMVPDNFGVQNETENAINVIYPNPSDGNIHLFLPEPETSTSLFSIYDMTGRLLKSGLVNGAGERPVTKLDLTHYQKGIYLLKLNCGKTIYENKIVIQ